MPTLKVAAVLYDADAAGTIRLITSVGLAGQALLNSGLAQRVLCILGDCGSPRLDSQRMTEAFDRVTAQTDVAFSYLEFGENLGHSGGCNAVATRARQDPEEFLLFLNPDAVLEEQALIRLMRTLTKPSVGVVDARQIPFEHPKDFDPVTGEQSWASGACLGVSADVFHRVGGFDAEHFWSYCNDVDLSWRIRLAGHKAVHVPSAVVHHDKRVDTGGVMVPTRTQDYQSTLGRLCLADRYGRPDIRRATLAWVDREGTDSHRAAAAEYRMRADRGLTPERLPGGSRVATFEGGEYARHRF